MRKYYYRKILILLFFLNLLAIGTLYIRYCREQLPNAIHIKKGQETSLQYDVPATAEINHQKIQLNHPFVLKQSQTGQYEMNASLFGTIPLKKIKVHVVDTKKVVPSGKVVGIYVETKGLLVLETETFTGIDGASHAPSSNKLYEGDYILAVNGISIDSKVSFMSIVNQCKGKEITLDVRRNSKKITIIVHPVMSAADHKYKIGAWVRDNTQGIGTLTYTSKNGFGGLGHGICDMDTGILMQIKGGFLLDPQIDSISKGQSGSPGEIVGNIYYKEENVIGAIEKNTEKGIYGTMTKENQKEYEVGYRQDIKEGKAYIISDICGESQMYEIKLRKVFI